MRRARVTLLLVLALAGCHGDAEVLSTSPSNGAMEVSIDTNVSITFSEPVPATWEDKAEFLVLLGGDAVPGRAYAEGATLAFDPDFPLALGSTYTAILRPRTGNQHPHFPSQTWTFTTAGVETNDVLYTPTDLVTYELWSVNFDGTRRRKLSGTLDLTSSCVFVRSPDKKRVAFMAVDPQTGIQELYATPVLGGPLVLLSVPSPQGQSVFTFLWAPDGSRIAYQIGDSELHTVRPDGTDDVNLTPAPGGGRRVNGFSWSPDSTRIAFNADFEQANRFVLRVTSATAAGSSALHALPATDGTGGYGWWSPESQRVAFIHDSLFGTRRELYVADPQVPLSAVRVDRSALSLGQQIITAFWIDGGSRLLYWGHVDSSVQADLYAVRPDGTDHRRITTTGVAHVLPSPDESHIAFVTFPDASGIARLSIYTPAPESLLDVSGPGLVWPGVLGFMWAGSTHVAYTATRLEAFAEAFAVRADGSEHADLLSGVMADNFGAAPAGGRVGVVADVDQDGFLELYSVQLNGGSVQRLSNPNPPRVISDFIWSSDGQVVLFRPARIEEEDTYYELHAARGAGGATRRISHDLGPTERVECYEPR